MTIPNPPAPSEAVAALRGALEMLRISIGGTPVSYVFGLQALETVEKLESALAEAKGRVELWQDKYHEAENDRRNLAERFSRESIAGSAMIEDRDKRIAELEAQLNAKNSAARIAAYADVVATRGVVTPCEACRGLGTRSYPSTATWRGGGGGQAFTVGVCDHCWGSGDRHEHGADLRKLEAQLAAKDEWAKTLTCVWSNYRQGVITREELETCLVVQLER